MKMNPALEDEDDKILSSEFSCTKFAEARIKEITGFAAVLGKRGTNRQLGEFNSTVFFFLLQKSQDKDKQLLNTFQDIFEDEPCHTTPNVCLSDSEPSTSVSGRNPDATWTSQH